MTVLYTDNFDAGTAGTLPANWNSISGAWAAKAAGAVSGTLGLGPSATTDGVIVMNTAAQTADGIFGYKVRWQSNTISSPIFRADATFQNGYLLAIDVAGRGVTLFKRVGGTFTVIQGQNSVVPTGFAVGDAVNVEVELLGSVINLRFWKDGTTRPSTPTAAWSDTTYGAAGYTGAYQANPTGANANGFDDYTVSNTDTAPAPTPTPTPSPTTISRTNAALRYSPYNWSDDGTARNANTTGSYVEFGFTGTSLAMGVVALTGLAGYPVVRAYIDNAPAIDVQLTSGQTTVSFATGLSSGNHTVRIVVAKLNEEAGWWNLTNAIRITGFVIDDGASVSAVAGRSKRMIFFGDSITQGVRVFGASPAYPTGMDGTRTIVPLLAKSLDAEFGQIGYGAQGYTTAGNGGVPAFNTAYSSYSSGASRLTGGVLSPVPDYVACMHGTNGSTSQADVATAITNLRAMAPSAIIFMIVPPGGFARAAITAAVNAAVSGGDRGVKLLDAGTAYELGLSSFSLGANERSPDGVHPYAWANAEFGAKVSAQGQRAIEPRRFTVIAA